MIPLSPNFVGGGAQCQFSGWGQNTPTGGLAPITLQRINTFTITNSDCRSRHRPENAARITDGKICTFTQAPQGTCYGDEGGSLISAGAIVGVASWQSPCAVGLPDVYEGIAGKRLWILSIIS